MKKHTILLYVIRQPSNGLVKIGVTHDIEKRLRDLQNATGQPLEVLGTYRLRDMETHCHEMGAKHRTLGEWFEPEVLDVLYAWLPRRHDGAWMARCGVCNKWFRRKNNRNKAGGGLCGSDLCRKAQARAVGTEAAKDPNRPKRGPSFAGPHIKISSCAVCGTQVETTQRRPRVLCDNRTCWQEYGRRVGSTHTAPEVPCSVEGCTLLARTRGWCPKHYARWRAHGDPTVARPYGRPRKSTTGIIETPRQAALRAHWIEKTG